MKNRRSVEEEIALHSTWRPGQLGAFAECAGCGGWNRLVKRIAENGGSIWMQPAHVCGDRIAGGPSRLVEAG